MSHKISPIVNPLLIAEGELERTLKVIADDFLGGAYDVFVQLISQGRQPENLELTYDRKETYSIFGIGFRYYIRDNGDLIFCSL